MWNIDNSTVTIIFTQSVVFNGLLFYLHDMKKTYIINKKLKGVFTGFNQTVSTSAGLFAGQIMHLENRRNTPVCS